MSEQWEKLANAHESMTRIVRLANETRRLFEAAGESPPASLLRLLGEGSGVATNGAASRVRFPPLDSPPRPESVPPDWIWVPMAECTPTTLVMALLRQSDGASKDVIDRISELRTGINPGSIHNIGARLEREGVIRRDSYGWAIKNPSDAPVLSGETIWWNADKLGKYEMAAHRRLVIRHILKQIGGLQIVQIVNHLTASDLCKAPITKDLVKGDMNIMQKAGTARRIGNSGKWELVDDPATKK